MGKPAWMEEEQERAEDLKKSGATANNTAPKLARVTRAPKRMQKAFYIQNIHAQAFEKLVFNQKMYLARESNLRQERIFPDLDLNVLSIRP